MDVMNVTQMWIASTMSVNVEMDTLEMAEHAMGLYGIVILVLKRTY